MSRRRYLSLLVVRGDGGRVMRLTFSTRLVTVGAASAVVVAAALGGVMLDWHQLRATGDAGSLRARLAGQQALIDRMNGTVRDLRRQVAGWRDVHARLLDAFGPDPVSAARGTGIGGPAAPIDHGRSVASRDELGELAASVAEESENLRTLDRLLSRAAKMLATLPSRWPVHGFVNSEFGNRPSPWTSELEFHAGMDIRAARGTLVRAPAAGTVTFAGSHDEYGLTVMLDHGHDVKTVYGHLSKLGVGIGQRVDAGASLGLTGSTGRSSGPHLHYEVLVQGRPINPRAYLWD